MSHPAVFLDRDGTLVHDPGYLCDPAAVRLLDGVSDALVRLANSGFRRVVITNQSGIARGLSTVEDYEAVRKHYESLLTKSGARIDASYYCPHHPEVDGPCKCRKPGTQLFEQAMRDFSLTPERVAYVGDRWRDVAAAKRLGGRGILVPSGMTTKDDHQRSKKDGVRTVATLGAAVEALFGLTTAKRAE